MMKQQAFTLMELLVVLFIISLLSSLAMPRLSTLFTSVDAAFVRDEVFAQISALGYQAQRQGRGFVLQHYPLPEADANDDTPLAAKPPPLPLQLPEDWRIYCPQPIHYFANGACSGGELRLTVQTTQYRLELEPPFCQARLQP